MEIKPSWTKGGVGRTLQITSDEQRQWLTMEMRQEPAGQSLIPKNRTYKQHLSHYQAQTKAMGGCKLHGLCHAYAQRRYQELTKQFDPYNQGLICPIAGGKSRDLLNRDERIIDRKAREMISRYKCARVWWAQVPFYQEGELREALDVVGEGVIPGNPLQ